jgi:predicted acetyltransferase
MKTRIENDIRVRTAKPADFSEVARIGMRSFTGPGTEERWQRYFKNNTYLPLERLLMAESNGKVVGTAALLDFKTTVEGRLCAMDGVAAVGVDPLARRQGVADVMMREAILAAHRRKTPVSMLYPFRASFYRNFGYAPVETAQVLHVNPTSLPDSTERAHVRAYRDEDRKAMERCYQKTLPGSTGLLKRDDFWWDFRVLGKNQERVVYETSAGRRVEGYAICEMVDFEHIGNRRFRVLELVANSVRARKGLLGWLASLGDEIGVVELYTSRDRSLIPFLRNPAEAGARVELRNYGQTGYLGWGAMARITHLERALVFRSGRGAKGTFTVQLSDPHLAANEQPVTVKFTGTGAKIDRSTPSRNKVRASVGVFSQIWMGAVSAKQALEMDEIECSAKTAELLDRAWFGPAPYLGPFNGF